MTLQAITEDLQTCQLSIGLWKLVLMRTGKCHTRLHCPGFFTKSKPVCFTSLFLLPLVPFLGLWTPSFVILTQADFQLGAPLRQTPKFGGAADTAILYNRHHRHLHAFSNVFSGKPVALFYKSNKNNHEKWWSCVTEDLKGKLACLDPNAWASI